MNFYNLEERPDLLDSTVNLIEECFGYNKSNSFDIDFAPLMQKSNLKNCHILVEEDKVLAHIGAQPRNLSFMKWTHPILFLGGICTHPKHRKQGLFSKIFDYVLDIYQYEFALFFLWSNEVSLYQKFSFYPAISQYAYSQKNGSSTFVETAFHHLNENEQEQIQQLYRHYPAWQCHRSESDWKVLADITSSKLFIKKGHDGSIQDYFFKDKGADLKNIIHESGLVTLQTNPYELLAHGNVWSDIQNDEIPSQLLYATSLKIGSIDLFSEFIEHFTNRQISVIEKNEETISFKYQEDILTLAHEEFLHGIFGPNRFEELSNLPNIRISGLDSI